MPQLEFPNLSHKQSYLEMISEWASFETVPTSPGRLFGWEFRGFPFYHSERYHRESKWRQFHLFFLLENERILWAIQIRHHIDHPHLIETGGHIGYGIRPRREREVICDRDASLGTSRSKKLWIERVLITCYDDNIASAKVIENNGGVFEIRWKEGKKLRRYWIIL